MKKIDISNYLEMNKTSDVELIHSRKLKLSTVLSQEITIFKNHFNSQKRFQFYNDLASLLKAGIDIAQSLDLIHENLRKNADRTLMNSIRNLVIEGMCFSDSLKKTGKFSEYEYNAIRIGEETGQLKEILFELAGFYNEKLKLRKKLISSLSYPVIVLCTAFGVIYFMISFIVPMFEDVFHRFGKDLPALTNIIIRFSHGIKIYLVVGFIMVIVIAIFWKFLNSRLWFRKGSSFLILKTPVVGPLMMKVYLSRFCLCMFLLIHSRTPLIESLKLVRNMIRFYPIQHSLDKIIDDILNGSSLNNSLKKFAIYDRRMVSMVKIAEETNQLDLIFKSLKDQYNNEIEQKTEILGNLLEPILIIFIGLFIGIILVSMYLPMFKLSTSFGF